MEDEEESAGERVSKQIEDEKAGKMEDEGEEVRWEQQMIAVAHQPVKMIRGSLLSVDQMPKLAMCIGDTGSQQAMRLSTSS